MKVTKSKIEQKKETHLIRHKEDIKVGNKYSNELYIEKGKVKVKLGVKDIILTNIRNKIHELRDEDIKLWGATIDRLIYRFIELVNIISVGGVYEPYYHVDNLIYSKDEDNIKIGLREDHVLKIIDEDFLIWIYKVIGYLITETEQKDFDKKEIEDYLEGMDDLEKSKYLGYLSLESLEGLKGLLTKEDQGIIEGYQVINGGSKPLNRYWELDFNYYKNKDYLNRGKKEVKRDKKKGNHIDKVIMVASIGGIIIALGMIIYYILYLRRYIGGV